MKKCTIVTFIHHFEDSLAPTDPQKVPFLLVKTSLGEKLLIAPKHYKTLWQNGQHWYNAFNTIFRPQLFTRYIMFPANHLTFSWQISQIRFNCYHTISFWLKLVAVERWRGSGNATAAAPPLALYIQINEEFGQKQNCAPEPLFWGTVYPNLT